MKKRLIILGTSLIILSLLIVGFTHRNNHEAKTAKLSHNKTLAFENQIIDGPIYKVIPDLYYGVDTRFAAIKKTDIDKATTIYDFLNEGEKQLIDHINSVDIIIIKNNQQSDIREYGTSDQFTGAQQKLIRSTPYFNHFTIRTEFKEKNKETGKLEARFFGPHITVVPDKQATYVNGKEALIQYFKDNSRNDMNIIEENKLGAIKISFIITKEGKVSSVKHDAMTTRYPTLDEKFMTLIENIPGKWISAENSKGEKIEQELVFTFGPANGC
jgi:hypothetical protein